MTNMTASDMYTEHFSMTPQTEKKMMTKMENSSSMTAHTIQGHNSNRQRLKSPTSITSDTIIEIVATDI